MTVPGLDRATVHRTAKRLSRRDPSLDAIYQRFGPPPLWKRPATFATFVRIILEQQVSLASAKSTFQRLGDHCDGKVTVCRVVTCKESGLRKLGFTRQKARYTIHLAEAVGAGRFQIGSLRHQNDSEVRRRITSQLGLGDWSADVFLLMALCRHDIFPVGDLALVKGLRELDGGRYESPEEIFERAKKWRPHRSVAARMIWQLYLVNRQQTIPS